MRSTDPDFETKAADVLALYLAPPQHAAVFCLDEKTAIQALDRVDTRASRCRPAERSATASNTSGTAPSRSTPR